MRVDEDAKKWRRDVGLNSPFSNTRPAIPRLLALAPLAAALTALAVCLPTTLRPLALRSCGIGLGAYLTTIHLVPVIARKIPRAKYGCDLLKRPPRLQIEDKDKIIPESLGLVSGVVFVLALVVADAVEADEVVDAHTLAAATLAIALAILLGFADDILDLEWRYKYALPPLMALPLLAAYDGGTVIRPPRFLRSWLTDSWLGGAADALLQLFGGAVLPDTMGLVDLGRAYSLYMVLLVVFCTNAVNIYAGVNGLECGQVYVIACSILTMAAVELQNNRSENYTLSVVFLPPFVATTLALLRSNWYPAQVFVGDTFTNYAGMALAVVAILGHFPVMLLLLMLPQLVNFLVSIPQLFKLRPCPRHRLPTYDERTGLLRCSYVNDRATIVDRDSMNLTLINVVLRLRPMTEPALAATLLVLQALCCALALFLRFGWAGGIY
jgi:UDP-N-acetylglucosamine--dolichyl-phosphate N-acetylglucosaminephosphotransferase